MRLVMTMEGASQEAKQRGLAAAQAVFSAADADPFAAASARFKLEGEQEELTPAEDRLAALWEQANVAAAKACCAPAEPDSVWCLELHDLA